MKKILLLSFLILFSVSVLAEDKVEINTASLAQLDKITGIGPALAQRIIDARPFSSVDDLLKVKGIGEKNLQKIKDQGLACVGCEIAQEISNSQLPALNQIQNPNEQKITIAKPIIYPFGIFINEIFPSPEGADETNEWIELYNANNFEVDLSGWKIKDAVGTAATFTILKDTKILAGGFLVFKRPETKIILNNDADSIELQSPDNKIISTVSYTKAPLGQSYNKTSGNWQWSKTPTQGTANIITSETLSNPKKSGNSNKVDKNFNVASINDATNQVGNEYSSNRINPWFLFLTALIITIISAIIVLLIKFKLNI